MGSSASDNVFIINSNLPIRNGIVVVEPQPGQIAFAGVAGQGSGGYILSHRVPDEREQDLANMDGYSVNVIGGRYLEQADPKYRPTVPASAADYAPGPGNNIATVLTYGAAGPGRCHVIDGVSWAYNAVPASGRITIQDAGVTVYSHPVTTSGHDEVLFDPPKRFSPNAALTITLAAGGPSVSGDISANAHWTV